MESVRFVPPLGRLVVAESALTVVAVLLGTSVAVALGSTSVFNSLLVILSCVGGIATLDVLTRARLVITLDDAGMSQGGRNLAYSVFSDSGVRHGLFADSFGRSPNNVRASGIHFSRRQREEMVRLLRSRLEVT